MEYIAKDGVEKSEMGCLYLCETAWLQNKADQRQAECEPKP